MELTQTKGDNCLALEECQFREMQNADLSSIVHIEQTAHISPWARLSFEESMTRGDYCRVIEGPGGVLAYHVTSKILEEFHILNVVTAPRVQGIGLGHALMQDILNLASTEKIETLFLEVRESNTTAQGLYKKWQFEQIAIRKHYYRPSDLGGQREHALVFSRRL